MKESQHWSSPVELVEAAVEAAVADDASPCLADESGAEEARGLVRGEAEEDLLDELLRECRR